MSDFETDADLIGYCELHCETPRALFIGRHVNRMLSLAGHPPDYVRSVPEDQWFSLHEPMARLCRLARARLKPAPRPPETGRPALMLVR